MRRAALVLLALAATAAAQDRPGESVYFPMTVGTQWVYRSGEGRVYARVTRAGMLDGELVARVESWIGDKMLAAEMVAVGADGLYRRSVSDQRSEPPLRFVPRDPKRGDRWEVDSKIGPETIKGAFAVTEEEVTVPAGKYKAVVIKSEGLEVGGKPLVITNWYARGVGPVKTTIKFENQDTTLELEKFETLR